MKYTGLKDSEVSELSLKYGKNVLPAEKTTSLLKIFLGQFTNPLVYLLLGASLISLFSREYTDVIFMLAVVVINSLFGFFQEYKTQKTLQAIKKLIKPIATVIRNGVRQKINVADLVPGDIVLLGAGDKIPADGKVKECFSFLVNEAVLTGESEAIGKREGSEVFMGTIVLSGRAVMEVITIGAKTKMGTIAQTIKTTIQPPTTLQIRLEKFTKTLIKISIVLSIIVFLIGWMSGSELWQMIQVSVVVLVAIIPEALVVVVTLIQAIAMNKISQKLAILRKLLAIETWGSTTVICADKTGTLTAGKMTVDQVDLADRERCLLILGRCNDLADTAEIAMWEYLKKQKDFGGEAEWEKYNRVGEIPFGSEHKFMATLNEIPENKTENIILVKGAPEIVLGMSKLTGDKRKEIEAKIGAWAKRGQKVMGLAYKKVPKGKVTNLSIEGLPKLEWGGLIGLWDPPRVEVKEALETAMMAGLKIKVITGDHRATAEKVMEFLQIKVDREESMDGVEIDKLSDEALRKVVDKIRLFARVTPQQKLRIVAALQERGEIVSMMGDGVNDAPALKKSNIGVVMGDASEVAKETADLVLIDNNFGTMVAAIEEGRVVYENIKKTIFFMLSNSFAEIILIAGSIFLKWPMPLTVVQILWTHLLCDGPEDIVLGFEPKEKEVMQEGPKRMDEPVLNWGAMAMIILISSLSGLLALGLFGYYGILMGDLIMGRTMAFMAISFNSIFYILSFRTFRKSFWRYENFFKNKWLFGSMGLSLFLMTTITYTPSIQKILEIAPLGWKEWVVLLLTAITTLVMIEMGKLRLIRK